MAAYAADPGLRQAHGAAGELRSRAYTWDAVNGAVADVYLRLVSAQDRARARLRQPHHPLKKKIARPSS